MYYVYILICADGTYYTGYTTDLAGRLRKHNLGQASKYTRSRLPVELAYYEVLPDKSSALKREMAIKKLPRLEKIRLADQV
ncbi:GIY-YIG nuclease family protein [Desulfoscipio gibsoniae]|uniref:Putative endonuclease containing a URI domain n=1 Tax=Desulfoscipio gibsoniae DSM 7213 TaxID=767817 RepID=R4KUQ5_9FIRM|nr:GIY-YIG nuclease family protein [Desulfoscipio gibsoniae]AGL03351.1 putative endonuclease containing a URI domain [Desulfoscipio gibsoniae DSM 7213]